jgi:hypothetical protein
MHAQDTSEMLRRSSRVPITVPLLVTSLDPDNDFSEVCETLVVSAHGCALRSPMKVEAGIPVHLHTKQGRQMMARIVDCQPMGSNPQGWRLGAQLDEPNNFWDLNPCPEDWLRTREEKPAKSAEQLVAEDEILNITGSRVPGLRTPAKTLDQQFSGDHLRKMIGQLLQPLQAELAAVREKVAQRENNRSRFEVSLSQIPPELEQSLWTRLRQDLGQRALQLAREESDRVLGAAHAAIERKLTSTQDELQQHASDQLKSVEQRVQALADRIAESVNQHFRGAVDELQHSVVEAENRLLQKSEGLAHALHQQLEEKHRVQLQDTQRLQETVAAEWSRVQTQLAAVDIRLANLDEATRRLESDFEARLSAMAGDVISGTKAQFESTAAMVLDQLSTRGAQQVAMQLDQACRRLTHVQNEIETSISEALQAQGTRCEQSFEQAINDLAQQCVGRWRLALASQLNSFAATLGDQLRVDQPSNNGKKG